ncbi:respiratory nitrate reductase delta chain [Cutibacterium acnes JCM 18918]|nr:respiratory nitrate reductase delta chain [Cutibacterium acnes JCM 18918]
MDASLAQRRVVHMATSLLLDYPDEQLTQIITAVRHDRDLMPAVVADEITAFCGVAESWGLRAYRSTTSRPSTSIDVVRCTSAITQPATPENGGLQSWDSGKSCAVPGSSWTMPTSCPIICPSYWSSRHAPARATRCCAPIERRWKLLDQHWSRRLVPTHTF